MFCGRPGIVCVVVRWVRYGGYRTVMKRGAGVCASMFADAIFIKNFHKDFGCQLYINYTI